jgi:hypothetical protein
MAETLSLSSLMITHLQCINHWSPLRSLLLFSSPPRYSTLVRFGASTDGSLFRVNVFGYLAAYGPFISTMPFMFGFVDVPLSILFSAVRELASSKFPVYAIWRVWSETWLFAMGVLYVYFSTKLGQLVGPCWGRD